MHPADDKRVHDKEARSLRAAGFEVVHLCPDPDAPRPFRVSDVDGIRIMEYPSKAGIVARISQLRRLYRLAAELDADTYHCNEVDSWFVGVALKIFRRKKCVFDVHEHYPSTFAESRFPPWLRPLVSGLVRLFFVALLPFTDRIVLAKRSVGNDFPCSAGRKVLVRNYTPIANLTVMEDRAPRQPNSPLTIVHLGLFGKARGWPEVLKALTLVNERINLKVIGVINDGTADEFHSTVVDFGLRERVQLLDWMPFHLAFNHLLTADVGLIAFQPHVQNHVYAMPHKLFDYMAAGMSVLIPSHAVEVAPIVENAQCGLLIDPSDPRDLALKIDELFKDPTEAFNMGVRGRHAVTDRFNWESEAIKLIKMYEGLA